MPKQLSTQLSQCPDWQVLLFQLQQDPASRLTPSGVSAASPTLPCKPNTKKVQPDELDIEQMSAHCTAFANQFVIY